jgi:hypothetical protein
MVYVQSRIQHAHDERIAAGRRVSAAIRAQRYLEQVKRQAEEGAVSGKGPKSADR